MLTNLVIGETCYSQSILHCDCEVVLVFGCSIGLIHLIKPLIRERISMNENNRLIVQFEGNYFADVRLKNNPQDDVS